MTARAFDAMALEVTPGPLVLEASAGTGKTFAIVQLAVRVVLGDTAVATRGPRHLLLVTFTKAATAELKERLRTAIRAVEAIHRGRRAARAEEQWIVQLLARIGPDATTRVANVVERLDELSVTTIHGFCVGVLEEFPQECGVPTDLVFQDDDASLVAEVLDDLLRARMWTDPWTATGITSAGWKREGLIRLVRDLRMHGTTTPRPAPAHEPALQRFQAALQSAAGAYDHNRLAELMAAVIWKNDSQLGDPTAESVILDQLDALLGGDPAAMGVLSLFDEKKLWDAMRKQKKEEKGPANALRDDPAITALAGAIAHRDEWLEHLRVALMVELLERLPARKLAERVATFGDQIRLVSEALVHPMTGGRLAAAMHERFDAVLVDEAQDTDPAQWSIFTTAFDTRPLVIVGDPKQAIYGWRGADLDAYLETKRRAGESRTSQLDTNWRSTPRLLAALEAVFTRAPDPFAVAEADMPFVSVKPGRDGDPLQDPAGDEPFRWLVAPELEKIDDVRARIRDAVVTEIGRLTQEATLDGRPVAPRDIAVLVRSNNDASAYQAALTAAGINAVVAGAGDVTASAAWREVATLVDLLGNPGSDYALRGAAATLLIGVPARELAAWRDDPDVASRQAFATAVEKATELADRRGTFAAVVGLLGQHDAAVRLAARPDGERWLTDLRHVLELLQEAEQEVGAQPIALAQWMAHWPEESDGTRERKQLRLESDADAVQVRTMHAAKGLEWPIVFVPSCWDGKNQSPKGPVLIRENGEWTAVFGHDPDRATAVQVAGEASWQEELRLCYVALTRARARCYAALGCGNSQTARGPIGWLLRPEGAGPDDKAKEEWPLVRQVVHELVEASGGTMALLEVGDLAEHSPVAPTAEPVALAARVDPWRMVRSWRTTSYTNLTSGADADADVADPGEPIDRTPRVDLDLLPAGATSGVAVHRIFELLDFDAPRDRIVETSQSVLDRVGLLGGLVPDEAGRVLAATATMTETVLAAQIPGWGFALRDVSRARTLREWHFNLALDGFDVAQLAEGYRASGGWLAGYADRVAALSKGSIDGFLSGVIDLAFEHAGKWYIVDWKSNHHGHAPGAYAPEALRREMMANHYVLQYHLYLLALERFLRNRVPGWDPATMFAGVAYVFVRGVGADGENGWYLDLPGTGIMRLVQQGGVTHT